MNQFLNSDYIVTQDKGLETNLKEWLLGFPPEDYILFRLKCFVLNTGYICNSCGFRSCYWKKNKEVFQCKSCGKRNSVKSQTPLSGSKLTARTWLMGLSILLIYPETSTTRFQSLLSLTRYHTAWNLQLEIRRIKNSRSNTQRFFLCGYDQAIYYLLETLWYSYDDNKV